MEREYSEVIEELRRALRLGDRIEESVLNEGIRYLENALSSILSRSKKHKYQSQLSHLLSIRARYEKRGSGLSDDEVRIKWEDVKSAFLCRIRTGQIVNFKHKDATAFLEDAFTIFEERIKEALAEHSMIKVNVELAAEYMTVNKDGEVIFGDKYFNTKNEHISRSTDLGEWFTTNVQESILKQMEESVSIRVHLIAREAPRDSTTTARTVLQLSHGQRYFYQRLRGCEGSVWGSFKISNLGEYSDLYLKTDVLLLVEIFENFRKTCHEAYELDPAHYYTLPGYSWDAMLLYTQVELELLTDIDMLLFVEKGIRGGVSQCCSRFAEANNKYMGEDYNPEKEDVYLMYYDVNNLYGWAMAQYLPYGGFEWADAKDYLTLPEDSEYGYILEVDLEYPESLHDSHKDLPLCPEHACPPGSKQRKLLTTLKAKHKYVIHYRSLQQAIRLGVQVTKVHRALKFKQGPWLKSYIDLNTEKRKNSNNDFEKQQYKLCNNAIFGKTMENVRKRIDVKLVSSWDGRYGAEAQISKPNFHSRAIFDENLVAIQLSKTSVTIDKPVYVGFSILDISKTRLYRFHYDFMRDRFGSNCKVLYTDTDSLVYEIRGQNVYEVMKHKDNINEFDTFDYEKDNPFGMPLLRENSKKIGLMKDELCGKILRRFCGLRSKMYSVDIQNGGVIKKIKGIKSSVVKNTITFDDYLQCLQENAIISREQHNIRSRLHVLRSEKERKIALSPHDDKRYLVPGTVDTLPWGHKDIANEPPAKKPKYN
ncbi:unnamed protein product [Trichogramma brassicae]|uniref:DNA-directed DNA polymerase n=1 Tax=Trichogramma brassicae TaxID=86971 RepID=A0A6H5I378_9HYME|nr:unnamed protein product [Trichogramma brassicae]